MNSKIQFDSNEETANFICIENVLDQRGLDIIEELFTEYEVDLFELKKELFRDTDDYLLDMASLGA